MNPSSILSRRNPSPPTHRGEPGAAGEAGTGAAAPAPGRRAVLAGGWRWAAAAALGSAAPARAQDGTRAVPGPWAARPGGPDAAYGMPSPHEAGVVVRASHDGPAQTRLFASWRTPIAAQRGIVTPSGLHFAVHHNGLPDIDPARHRLVIHGMVERPLQFDLDRLARYPMVSRLLFIECSGNSAANAMSPWAMDLSAQDLAGEVSCSEWTGVPLRLLLQEAGLKPGAAWVIAEGADGGSHQRSLPLAKLLDDAVLAFDQNGERLRPSQGYPLRLLLPGWEGNTSVKWLHRLEVCDQPAYTKDESGLYSEVLADGRIERFTFPMAVKSLITHPSGRQQMPEPRGSFEIAGLAWSGRGRITRVEVSTDGGARWVDARLHAPVLAQAFTRFSLPWRWDGRPATLLSRAHDDAGDVQPTRAAWKKRYAAHAFNHYNAIHAWQIHRDGRVENRYV